MEYAHPRNDHTHARSISFHDTFARKRTRTNRSNAFYRSFAFAKFFHIAAFARFGAIFCSFREKKRFFKIHFSWKPTKQTRASERVQRATRESRERERKESESRAIEREREREGTRTGGFTGSLFRTSHVDFLKEFFFCADSFEVRVLKKK